ncbi:MAG: hypothetical protein SVZ03_08440 [Spirochaetota bacterium]|nr:hypothetical protein [Spirochaetota bacterium]
MNIFFLVIINFTIGFFFYLIIRLKLEKSTTTYKEIKLRREMDEIIREFDATAERNISILENRIAVMKRILFEAEKLTAIDFSIKDYSISNNVDKESLSKATMRLDKAENIDKNNDDALSVISNYEAGRSHGMVQFRRICLNRFNQFLSLVPDSLSNISKQLKDLFKGFKVNRGKGGNGYEELDKGGITGNGRGADIIDSRCDDNPDLNLKDDDYIDSARIIALDSDGLDNLDLSEDYISGLFMISRDKYSLIPELHNKGCPIDTLSKCSGIPIGEVKLILDLNNSI